MASLVRPWITTYHLPDGTRVKKATPGASKKRRRSKYWYAQYKDEAGEWVRKKLCTDKTAAQQLLVGEAVRAENTRLGIGNRFAEHLTRPLIGHLEDFRRALEARNNSPKHVRVTHTRVLAVLDGCRITLLADVQASQVAGWLAEERKAGRMSIVTSNYYLRDTKSFFTWLVKDGRAPTNPLSYLSNLNTATEEHRERRTLPRWEFEAMLWAAQRGKRVRKVDGPDRFMLYLVGGNTGFRAQELASLVPESFRLDQPQPTVTVAAGYSKHKREDVQPIRPDLAEILSGWVAGKPAGQRLWPGGWWRHAAKMIRADLKAARAAWIGEAGIDAAERQRREKADCLHYEDADGKVFDFHCLRGQFISDLEAAGVSPKMLQTLARHADIKTTLKHYARVQLSDTQAALDKLPPMPGKAPGREALRTTGTGPTCTNVAQTFETACDRVIIQPAGNLADQAGGVALTPVECEVLRLLESDCDLLSEEAPPGFEPGMADLQSDHLSPQPLSLSNVAARLENCLPAGLPLSGQLGFLPTSSNRRGLWTAYQPLIDPGAAAEDRAAIFQNGVLPNFQPTPAGAKVPSSSF